MSHVTLRLGFNMFQWYQWYHDILPVWYQYQGQLLRCVYVHIQVRIIMTTVLRYFRKLHRSDTSITWVYCFCKHRIVDIKNQGCVRVPYLFEEGVFQGTTRFLENLPQNYHKTIIKIALQSFFNVLTWFAYCMQAGKPYFPQHDSKSGRVFWIWWAPHLNVVQIRPQCMWAFILRKSRKRSWKSA